MRQRIISRLPRIVQENLRLRPEFHLIVHDEYAKRLAGMQQDASPCKISKSDFAAAAAAAATAAAALI